MLYHLTHSMKLSVFSFVVLFLMASCQSNSEKQVGEKDSIKPDRSEPDKPGKDYTGCYIMLIKKDTARLDLSQKGNEVSGDLSYHWYEKDHNDGTIRGLINDSLIIADYTFRSEGVTSVRQVVFKLREDSLYQGYGEERVHKDTALFRDIKLVIFDTKHPFIKGCQ